jgi:multidrug resistance protein MdtO
MALAADAALPRSTFLRFLQEELAPRPGRVAAAARIAVGCTVVVAIAMLYRIPLPAYMAYIVFLISRDELASTLMTGIGGALAATLAIGLTLLFYTLDASEPALRLPLMAAGAFIGMFMSRTMALGPIGFLAGFVLVLSQTLIDVVPTLEVLVRLVLWLWVVVLVPDAVTLLLNLATGESPARLARRTALGLLRSLEEALREGSKGSLRRQRAEAIVLVELRQRAGMLDRDLRDIAAADTNLIETLAELFSLVELLPADTPGDVRKALAESCEESIDAFERGTAPPLPRAAVPASGPVALALAAALARLRTGLARRRPGTAPPLAQPVGAQPVGAQPVGQAAKSLFVPDAFTNPEHTRFALKTTLAVMAAYVIYSGLDWPGISTSITTCFFVALGSLGETMHKLTLRLSGAMIGGLAAGLSIVFLLPAMTDIGQLCLLIAASSFVAAWVATSSELLSYAGMQIAFAFFLGVLQGYGPSTDLEVLRDRVVGILLGNVLITLVFSVLWPASAADRARASLADALGMLGRLLTDDTAGSKTGSRLAVVRALAEARRLLAIDAFELRILQGRAWPDDVREFAVGSFDRLAASVFVVIEQRSGADEAVPLHRYDEAVAAWLAEWSARASAGGMKAIPGGVADLARPLASLSTEAAGDRGAAIAARRLLQSEMEATAAAASGRPQHD